MAVTGVIVTAGRAKRHCSLSKEKNNLFFQAGNERNALSASIFSYKVGKIFFKVFFPFLVGKLCFVHGAAVRLKIFSTGET